MSELSSRAGATNGPQRHCEDGAGQRQIGKHMLSARLEICRLGRAGEWHIGYWGHAPQCPGTLREAGNLQISGGLFLRVARLGLGSHPRQCSQIPLSHAPHAMRAMVLWIKLCGRRGAPRLCGPCAAMGLSLASGLPPSVLLEGGPRGDRRLRATMCCARSFPCSLSRRCGGACSMFV